MATTNGSVAQALSAALLDRHDQLGYRLYRTTDGFRHTLDYRIAVTVKHEVVGDLASVDRHWFDRNRTNKADREERDDYVAGIVAGIKFKKG